MWCSSTCRDRGRRPTRGCCLLAESGAGCDPLGRPASTCDPEALTASLYPARPWKACAQNLFGIWRFALCPVNVSLIVSIHHTDLPPHAGWVPYVPPAVGQLSYAVVDGHTAPSLTQVLLCHLHPAQRSNRKRLKTILISKDSSKVFLWLLIITKPLLLYRIVPIY